VKIKKTVVASAPAGFAREKGYLYFVDGDGDISRTKTPPGHTSIKYAHRKVARLGVARKPDHWYYPDKLGRVIEFRRPQ